MTTSASPAGVSASAPTMEGPISGDSVHVLDGPGTVPALAAAGWDDLLTAAGPGDALRRSEVLGLDQPLLNGGHHRAVLVVRDGALVAAAPLRVHRERGLVTVRHLGEPSGWLCPEPPVVDAAAAAALARALLDLRADVLVLEDLDADGPMVRALRRAGAGVETVPGPVAYRADTRAAGRAVSKRRSEARRLMRRAEERGMPLRVTTSADWDGSIASRLEGLLEFGARSLRAEADVLTGTPEGRAATAQAVGALGARGSVRLALAEAGDEVVAFHLALVSGDRAVGFKSGAVRERAGLSGFGWLTMLAMNDALAAEGVVTIEMGHGGDTYKGHIAAPAPLVTVRAGLSPRGRAYLALVRAGRSGIRRVRGRLAPTAAGAGAWVAVVGPAVAGA